MMATRLAGLALASILAGSGCSACDHGGGPPGAESAAPETAAPTPFTGPLPASAKRDERAAEVYRLLAGGRAAKALPERAVDDGVLFDRNLKDKVAPGASAP